MRLRAAEHTQPLEAAHESSNPCWNTLSAYTDGVFSYMARLPQITIARNVLRDFRTLKNQHGDDAYQWALDTVLMGLRQDARAVPECSGLCEHGSAHSHWFPRDMRNNYCAGPDRISIALATRRLEA